MAGAEALDGVGRVASVSRRLDFIVGGAQKSGTTTLDAVLRTSPAIQMASVKETHVFDDEALDWSDPRETDLEAYFPAKDDRLRGEATPITLYWRPAIRRLSLYNPGLKIVLLLRDPVVRAYAHWRKEVAAGLEDLAFADAIRSGRERVAAQAETEGLHRTFSYVERGLYGQQLAYLSRHFPRSHIHCEIFEEFVTDPDPALERIAGFLGIGSFEMTASLPHLHPGKEIGDASGLTAADAEHLRRIYREDVAETEMRLGRSLDLWRLGA
jgi:hypothetical protein